MGGFNNLKNQINSAKEVTNNYDIKQDYSLANNPAFSIDYAKDIIIHHLDELDDEKLYSFIKKAYPLLLADIFEKDEKSYLEILINKRVLGQLIYVLNDISEISYNEHIYCNKLAYDYMTMVDSSDETMKLLLSLSKIVNKKDIMHLNAIGIKEKDAALLALSRFSSFESFVNVRRLNHTIMMLPVNEMSTQTIIYIYEKLFDRFSELFEYTMFDYYDRDTLHNMSSGSSEIYSNISLAIFIILENLESSVIRKILINYAGNYRISGEDNRIRFSIKSLSIADNPRILKVVDNLELNEMIIIP